MDSLDTIYKEIPLNSIGLTSLMPLQEVANQWIWTAEESHKSELKRLLAWAHDRFGYHLQPYGAQGPGLCLPRQFLEAYSSIEVPELCNDEVRIPLFGQIFGFDMHDTHFCVDWFAQGTQQTFHCQTQTSPAVRLATVKRELATPAGTRVFHPFRKIVILDRMDYVRSFLISVNHGAMARARRVLYPLFLRYVKQEGGSSSEKETN
jgi:hypothetical protein